MSNRAQRSLTILRAHRDGIRTIPTARLAKAHRRATEAMLVDLTKAVTGAARAVTVWNGARSELLEAGLIVGKML